MRYSKEQIENFFENKSMQFKQKIRDEAVRRAKNSLRRTGRKINQISLEDYKEMISAEEEEIKKSAIKWGAASIIFGGFMPWW